jgi:radical SAM protein with 4Fe4S-binding SPASM domain
MALARRNGKHAYIFRHLTPKRLINYITVKFQKKLRLSVLKGRPYHLIVDPGNICNFRCPLCRTGARINRRKQGMMSFANFKRFIDPLADHVLLLTLHNWGEPFLNKDIYKMIAYAKSKGLAIRLSTNLYAMSYEDLERTVDSGLDHIRVSLDGTNEETYVKYRVGGHFQQVFNNIKTLIEIRNRQQRSFPVIEWQFLVMRHNEHEIPEVSKFAEELGVDLVTFGAIGLNEAPYDGTYDQGLAEEWLPRHHSQYRHRYGNESFFESPCFFLWESVTINWDGGIAPCCVLDDPSMDFGNILEEPFKNIWNNELYLASRREFNPRLQGNSGPTVCLRCKIFSKR